MSILLIAIGLAIYTFLALKRTEWGVFLVTLLLPTYLIRFTILDIPFTFVEAMIWILFVLWILKKLQGKEMTEYLKSLPKKKFYYPALLLLTAATISVFVAADRVAALGIWKAYFVVPILFYFIFTDVVKREKQMMTVLRCLVASAGVISLITIVQYFTGFGIPESYDVEGARRATAIYGYPAAVGLFIAPMLSLVLGMMIATKAKLSEFYKTKSCWVISISASVLMVGALIASRTDGAWVAVAVSTFVVMMFTKWRWKVVVLSLLLVILVFAVPQTRDYVLPLVTFQDTSGDVRLAIWQGTARLIADNPVFGVGLAGFPAMYEQYKEAKHVELSLYPHNIILNFWVELGVLGVMALSFIVYKFFKQGYLNIKRFTIHNSHLSIPLVGVMICILVYGIVDVPYFKNDLSILFWIWIGLASVSVGDIVKSK